MSWDQGIQLREELPERFVKWADERLSSPLAYITWFESDTFYLEGEDGSQLSCKVTAKPK